MRSILVTGGAGYIGSHACKMLSKEGYEPIVYDNLSTGHKDAVKWGPLIIGDLQDTTLLSDTLNQYKPDAVIHFAASAYVGESITNPFKYYLNNVGGTISLLNAMQENGINKLIFSSTCATYGTPSSHLINEECPQHPINPYGQSKLMIEKILLDLSITGQIQQVSLRYFNAAGNDKDGEIGENHSPETHLIPLAIQSAYGGEKLKIFGTDFDTPDGTAIRDYIHVEDLAHAHITAIKYLASGGPSDFFNLGTGQGQSVREIITALNALGIVVNFCEEGRRPGDPSHLVADSSKARSILNWKPKYSNIDQILQTAIGWHIKSPG